MFFNKTGNSRGFCRCFHTMLVALLVIFTENFAFASCPAGRIDYVEGGSSVCSENKFQITTIPNTTEIKFIFFAAGTYYVDCDINSTSDTVKKVIVEDSKSAMEAGIPVTCSYDIGGEYTIGFGGEAVNYIASSIVGSQWYKAGSDNCSTWGVFRIGEKTGSKITSHASKIKALSGSIGKLFPTLPDKPQPTFTSTFSGTTNLTSIHGNLFNGVYGQPGVCMFNSTFYGTGAENIPIGLFSYINGTAEGLFTTTFGWSKIKSIDPGVFRTIKGPARVGMFSNMFIATKNLTSIPENLFSGITKDPNYPSTGLFKDIFRESNIKKLPNKMFDDYVGKPDTASFKNIFVSNPITGYIPYSLLKNLDSTGYDANGNTSPLDSIFNGTNLSYSCPENMYKVTTGFEGDLDSISSTNVATNPFAVCEQCPNGGTSPAGSVGVESCSAAALVCAEGQYLSSDQTSCPSCPSAYPNSPRGSHSISQCYATVTYKFNNDSDDESVDIPYSASSPDSYSIKLPEPSKIDYVFVGWNKNSNFSEDALETPATLSGNQTLYAQWTQIQCAPGSYLAPSGLTCLSCPAAYPNSIYDSKNIYACFATVTFYPNNDSDNTKENFYYTDTTSQGYKIDKTPATNTEYEFTGWFDNISFSGTPITKSTLLSGNKNLYALYGYSIDYDLDGGVLENGKTNPSRYKNTESPFTLNNPTKPGYIFTGWCQSTKTCSNAQTNMIVDPATLSGNQNFYAKWTPITYTITFDSNGGDGYKSDIVCTYDSYCDISNNEFEYTDYIYLGWDTNKTATTPTYPDSTNGIKVMNLTTVNNATVLLYAIWKEKRIDLKYMYDDTNVLDSCKYNSSFTTLAPPAIEKPGFRFVGWIKE